MILGLTMALLAAACTPPYPTHPGYVSTAHRSRGNVDVGVMGGAFYSNIPVGGAELKLDPYVTPRLSIPIEAAGAGSSFGGGGAARLGVRFRALPVLGIGAGVGGGFYVGQYMGFGALHLDVELALGLRRGWFGMSFALRPTFEAIRGWFLMPTDVSFAFYPLKRFAITVHVFGGPWVHIPGPDAWFWVGGALGFMVHL